MKITIIFDRPESGDSTPDYEDVLNQVETVRSALISIGHECSELGLTADLKDFSRKIKMEAPDLVFNLVESVDGKGSLIYLAPAILDTLDISYTGSKTDSIYRTSNKLHSKDWLNIHGIPTPDYISMDGSAGRASFTGGEYIIKSVWEHASIGLDNSSIVYADSVEMLLKEMERRKKNLGGQCFAERYIEGREFNISILAGADGPEMLPPAEIRFESFNDGQRKIVGYEAKWDQGSFEYNNTVRSFTFSDADTSLLARLKERSLKCWKIFRIRGYCRVDFRVDKNNRAWLLEVNSNPCISSDAGFMAAAGRAGLKAEDVIKRIINDSNTVIQDF